MTEPKYPITVELAEPGGEFLNREKLIRNLDEITVSDLREFFANRMTSR